MSGCGEDLSYAIKLPSAKRAYSGPTIVVTQHRHQRRTAGTLIRGLNCSEGAKQVGISVQYKKIFSSNRQRLKHGAAGSEQLSAVERVFDDYTEFPAVADHRQSARRDSQHRAPLDRCLVAQQLELMKDKRAARNASNDFGVSFVIGRKRVASHRRSMATAASREDYLGPFQIEAKPYFFQSGFGHR